MSTIYIFPIKHGQLIRKNSIKKFYGCEEGIKMKINDNILDDLYQKKTMFLEIEALKTKVAQLEKKLSDSSGGASNNSNNAVYVQQEVREILNGYQKKFYEYKQTLDTGRKINLNRISMPFIKDKVSVILPVYNGDDYVTLSIESVLNQTYENFELIIIDDGSTDGTPEIVDRFAEKDGRIRVIHQENRKLPKTLSRGFRLARGEYLTWTSADNIMHSEFIERFVENMRKYPDVDMFYGNMKLIDEVGNEIKENSWRPEKDHPENVMLPWNILELNTYPSNYIGAAFMYRYGVAQIIEDYASNRYGIEDYDYWMKVNDLLTLRHVDFTEPLYCYRFHSKSLTSRDKELKITENRYMTMSWDNTRRDYFLKPLIWILGECDKTLLPFRNDMIKYISQAGDSITTLENLDDLGGDHYYNLVLVEFGDNFINNEKKLPENTFRVVIRPNPLLTEHDNYDCYISTIPVEERDYLSDFRGWFGVPDADQAVALISGKANIEKLADLEEVLMDPVSVQLSLIVLSNGDEKALSDCLDSIWQSKTNKDEVIVVANSSKALSIQDVVKCYSECRLVKAITEDETDMLNLGIWNSNGKYISFLTEDCIVEKGYCQNIEQAFENADRLAVVCGTVKYSNVTKRELYKGYGFTAEKSELLIKDEEIYELGCVNLSFRSHLLKNLGGLQKAVQNEDMDLPDISIQALLHIIKRHDWYIMALDYCSVIRQYSADILLSKKHTRLLSYYIMNKSLAIEKYTDLDYIQRLLNKKERIEFRYIYNDAKRLEAFDAKAIRKKYSEQKVQTQKSNPNITVSVIVPVYNVQDYLPKCLDSLCSQSFTDYEILLIDDGSQDQSGEICDKYAEEYDRITTYHKTNGGLSDARNYGIGKAKGEYLFFVDSDDWVDQDAIKILYRAAVRYQADIVECSYRNIYKDSVKEETDDTSLIIAGDNIFALKSQLEWIYFKSVAWNKLYKRTLFTEDNLYTVGRYHEDEFTTHKLFYASSNLVYIDYALYNYNQTRGNSITAKVTSNILDSCYALRDRVRFFQKNNITELDKKVKDMYCWFLFDRISKCGKAGVNDRKLRELLELLAEEYTEVQKWDIPEEYKRKYFILAGYGMFGLGNGEVK